MRRQRRRKVLDERLQLRPIELKRFLRGRRHLVHAVRVARGQAGDEVVLELCEPLLERVVLLLDEARVELRLVHREVRLLLVPGNPLRVIFPVLGSQSVGTYSWCEWRVAHHSRQKPTKLVCFCFGMSGACCNNSTTSQSK